MFTNCPRCGNQLPHKGFLCRECYQDRTREITAGQFSTWCEDNPDDRTPWKSAVAHFSKRKLLRKPDVRESDEPIRGTIAIGVKENGEWYAVGWSDDPEGKAAAACVVDFFTDDGTALGQIYYKPVEFWPPGRQKLGEKAQWINSEADLIGHAESAVEDLLMDGDDQLDRKITNTLSELKSLIRLKSFLARELEYYEEVAEKPVEDIVQEAIQLVEGTGSQVLHRTVEHRVEQTHRETVTFTSTADARLAERVAEFLSVRRNRSERTCWGIADGLEADENDVGDVLTKLEQFVKSEQGWWYEPALPQFEQQEGETRTAAYGRQVEAFIRVHGPTNQTHLTRILGTPLTQLQKLRNTGPFATDKQYNFALAELTPEEDRWVDSEEDDAEIDEPGEAEQTEPEITDEMIYIALEEPQRAKSIAQKLGVQNDQAFREKLSSCPHAIKRSSWWWRKDKLEEREQTRESTRKQNTTDQQPEVSDRDQPMAGANTHGQTGTGAEPGLELSEDGPAAIGGTEPLGQTGQKVSLEPAADLQTADKAVDHHDSDGHTPDDIATYIRQRMAQSKSGDCLIEDLAEELGVGSGAIVAVIGSMEDVGRTERRVIRKSVRPR